MLIYDKEMKRKGKRIQDPLLLKKQNKNINKQTTR